MCTYLHNLGILIQLLYCVSHSLFDELLAQQFTVSTFNVQHIPT